MSKSKRLVFYGNERLATGLPPIEPLVLPALVKAGYEIDAVITSHVDAVSRQKRDLEIGPVAQALGIPVILAGKGTDLVAKAKHHPAEAAVLVAFGRMIPESVINLYPKGIINLHPSLLPAYRGSTPLEQTILDGLTESGISLMKLVPEMDAGPVFAQQPVKLSGHETKAELAAMMLAAGRDLLIDKLPEILNGMLLPQQQNNDQATYTKLLSKADGLTTFSQPAPVIERQVRAYAGFPKLRATINGHEVVITKARVVKQPVDGSFSVECQPGWLEIQELIAPSGKTMSGADFLRGYKL